MEENRTEGFAEDLGHEETRPSSGHRYRYKIQREIIGRECGEKVLFDDRHGFELSLSGAELALWDVDLQKDTMFVNQTWADICGHCGASWRTDLARIQARERLDVLLHDPAPADFGHVSENKARTEYESGE